MMDRLAVVVAAAVAGDTDDDDNDGDNDADSDCEPPNVDPPGISDDDPEPDAADELPGCPLSAGFLVIETSGYRV